MTKNTYQIIGLMSGTSRDGIDIAYLQFDFSKRKPLYSFLITETLSYSEYWENILNGIENLSKKEVHSIDKTYTKHLAFRINEFIEKHAIKNIDAVCSHGHTVFHEPENQYTLQIGNLPELAHLIQQKVVCDFRVQDVKLGGQGAPLVPLGDYLLFSEFDGCINLGGFANISLTKSNQRIAYDICAVNTVLNHYAQKLGKAFDKNGAMAKEGKIDVTLLNQLNQLQFYQEKPPKSLGIGWVKEKVFPLLQKSGSAPLAILSTYTEHVARQLTHAVAQPSVKKVLLTGGGVFNTYLIERLKAKTDKKIILPEPQLIDYKEALIFGLLGVLKLRGEINALKSVTGAAKNHSSGKIYTPH